MRHLDDSKITFWVFLECVSLDFVLFKIRNRMIKLVHEPKHMHASPCHTCTTCHHEVNQFIVTIILNINVSTKLLNDLIQAFQEVTSLRRCVQEVTKTMLYVYLMPPTCLWFLVGPHYSSPTHANEATINRWQPKNAAWSNCWHKTSHGGHHD